MRGIVWFDGPHGTVTALRISNRSAPYYRCPVALISCMYLMPVIRCAWSVTYVFNALPACVPDEAMIDLMSGALGTHGYARGPRAIDNVAAPIFLSFFLLQFSSKSHTLILVNQSLCP
jgi:hypothetical protein